MQSRSDPLGSPARPRLRDLGIRVGALPAGPLNAITDAEEQGLTGDDAVMHAFEANKSDVARVSGN